MTEYHYPPIPFLYHYKCSTGHWVVSEKDNLVPDDQDVMPCPARYSEGEPCPGFIGDALVEAWQMNAHTIDRKHLEGQRAWSLETFGPGRRTLGVLDHIRKELSEIERDPEDLMEWVDVIILAFDGAWRAGWEPQDIIDAIKIKQATNQARKWPDWRTMSEDQAIEHDRSEDPPKRRKCHLGHDGCDGMCDPWSRY